MRTSLLSASKGRLIAPILLLAIFNWQVWYGLSQNFWHEDVLKIYLLGLKYATTDAWPYFGPDVIHTGQHSPSGITFRINQRNVLRSGRGTLRGGCDGMSLKGGANYSAYSI